MTASFSFGPYKLIPAERRLMRDMKEVSIGSRALDILMVLAEQPGEIVSHRDLLARVWPTVLVEEANLRVHIRGLRKALGDGEEGARYIANVPGRGYCFVAAVAESVPVPLEAVPVSTARAVAPPPCNLPPPLARMVGRDDTVVALCGLLTERRFVSIVGSGGMGKTTVALSVANALAPDFANAAYFVDLAALTDPALVATAIGSALGAPGPVDSAQALLALISDRRVLLVLDNCEHLIEAVALMAERLHVAAPCLHILATSREALRVEGEHVHLLRPLEGAGDTVGLTATRALEAPAIRLFMDRAAASGHAEGLSDEDAIAVAGLCQRLDGIALAIELVASRVGTLGIAGIAELLGNRFRLQWQGRRSALPRHQTLQAMLDWSFHLLTDRERHVLVQLAVFVGPFSPAGAQQVIARPDLSGRDVAGALQGLVDKSLIWAVQHAGTAYFRLPDTTRAYLLAKLNEDDGRDKVSERHALHVMDLLGPATLRSEEADRREFADLVPLLGNVRAALDWCFSHADRGRLAFELAVRAAPRLLALSLHGECRRWCGEALAMLPDSARGTLPELVLQQGLATSAMFSQGNGDLVRAAIERGLELAVALDAKREQHHLLAGLHIFLTRVGDFDRALAVAEQSLASAIGIGAVDARIVADWTMGCSLHLVGDQRLAQAHCEAGFDLAARSGETRLDFFGYDHRIRALIVYCRTLWLRGEAGRAQEAGHRAIAEAEQRDHPVSLCIALIYTATVLLWDRDLAGAETVIERLVAHAARHALGPYHTVGLALQGELFVASGNPEAGADMLRKALALFQAEQHVVLATGTTRALAEALIQLERIEEAAALLDDALADVRPGSGNKAVDVADLLRCRAEIELARVTPDLPLAEDFFRRSLAVANAQAAPAWELRATLAFARFQLAHGRPGEARALLAAMIGRFTGTMHTSDLPIAVALLATLDERPA
jgi:predicted ATPase/DNA-binding winged helix-turn-helix (wHTH) protein